MTGFKKEMLEYIAQEAEKQLEQGDTNCDNCGSQNLMVEVWVDGNNLEGEALCRDCNETLPVEIDADEAVDAGEEIDSALEDFQDTLDSF